MIGRNARVRRVLICEDSLTYAAALARALRRDPGIEVVAVCGSAETAIARLKLEPRPDLVTMDLELPGISGSEAIEQIMDLAPTPIIALAGGVGYGSRTARAVLAAGALAAVPKDDLDLLDSDSEGSKDLRHRVKVLAGVPVVRHERAGLGHSATTPAAPAPAAILEPSASVIGVAASAGGPQALAAVFAGIPATFPIPILVVQHTIEGSGGSFTRWLDGQVPLSVRVAPNGGEAAPGIWIAPDAAHLSLDGARRMLVDPNTDAGFYRPSADVLLRSLAACAGRGAVAVVLTGMGRDGAEGLAAVRRAGGLTIAQDEATSDLCGMPRAAAERGAQLIMAPDDIGRVLRALRPAVQAS